MSDSWQEFIEAIRRDEYSEYRLTEDWFLITDWEGDGNFHPYIAVRESGRSGSEYCHKVEEKLPDELNVRGLEWDARNGVYHLIADKPTGT